MKRKHKTYSRPKKPFDKMRLEEEAKLKKEFGLKNKKEIWKAEAKVKKIRERAKKLISSKESQEAFFRQINKLGFNVSTIADALAIDIKDYLNRRLQTLLFIKKLSKSPKEARQMISHKKVFVGDSIVSSPSYIVKLSEEDKIFIKKKNEKQKTNKQPQKQEASN